MYKNRSVQERGDPRIIPPLRNRPLEATDNPFLYRAESPQLRPIVQLMIQSKKKIVIIYKSFTGKCFTI